MPIATVAGDKDLKLLRVSSCRCAPVQGSNVRERVVRCAYPIRVHRGNIRKFRHPEQVHTDTRHPRAKSRERPLFQVDFGADAREQKRGDGRFRSRQMNVLRSFSGAGASTVTTAAVNAYLLVMFVVMIMSMLSHVPDPLAESAPPADDQGI